MERKKSSFVHDFFPRKEAASPTKSDILSSIFPPRSQVVEQDSLHHGSFPLRERKKGSDDQNSTEKNGASVDKFRDCPTAKFHDSPSKCHDELKNNNDPIVLGEIAKNCPMSSSVHYGCRDDFIPESSSYYKSVSTYNNRKDKQDDFSNSDVASRGDWWQGSLYY